ncbi:MAG TPA: aspartate--tRNA ligase [Myxococcales bacterium]|nr:aspartate--tRNA ligase [Myxococcales bacterium]
MGLLEVGRTHDCGALHLEHTGEEVILMGWVDAWRDLGGRRFIDLRDRGGVTQVVFGQELDAELDTKARRLRHEWVIAVRGRVDDRVANGGTVNRQLATGAIEVRALELEILTESETPPFEIKDDVNAAEELRLKYRYLDLRRQTMQRNLIQRHRFNQAVREFMDGEGFLELETPFLIRSTPEGARDYVVPSRVHPNTFYALPQSPQLFKQLFMVAGYDRYFQIARCFRDEDLRADRQPEFTQIDMEMSFATVDSVLGVIEGLMVHTFKKVLDVDIETPFPRIEYADAMERFGSDAPDLRFGMELRRVDDLVINSDFGVFTGTLEAGGAVKGICLQGGGDWSRKQIENLIEIVKPYGAKGLAWTKVTEDGFQGGIARFFTGDAATGLRQRLEAESGDLMLFVADKEKVVNASLNALRKHLAAQLGLADPKVFPFCWVTRFPLFERDEDTGALLSSHHPFTAPEESDPAVLEADPVGLPSQAYDLVLNGYELGSGSIRIHQREMQEAIFRVLGLSPAEQQEKFGFLLDAFRYGPPPHGGIALGVDRLVMLMVGAQSIPEVIAFPKTLRAQDLMLQAPGRIDEVQLDELHLAFKAQED